MNPDINFYETTLQSLGILAFSIWALIGAMTMGETPRTTKEVFEKYNYHQKLVVCALHGPVVLTGQLIGPPIIFVSRKIGKFIDWYLTILK